jgi:nitrogenase molybdenum-iron protein beta chain
MSTFIEFPRYTCALGAQQSVVAIPKAVPISHSGPGCGTKIEGLIGQGEGYAGGNTIPCTNVSEMEVIYGGENKLRSVIQGAFQVLDADLYVVLSGCTSDIVGDDIASVVSEYQKTGHPIVYAETGGFKSNNYRSHEVVVNQIVDQYVDHRRQDGVSRGLVNVFASIPYQDPFWNGNLEELKRILQGIGLKVNILFGNGSEGVAEWQTIPNAQFNLVVGAWVGVGIAEHLKELYGTPYFHFPYFPIGAHDTSLFLRQVTEYAGCGSQEAERFIQREEKKYYGYLDTTMDFLLEFRYGLPRRSYSLLDASYALGFSRFLFNEVGIIPAKQFVLDDTPAEFQEEIRSGFRRISDRRSVEVSFSVDAGLAHEQLLAEEQPNRALILGSAWERELAKRLGADLLIVSVPVTYRLILGCSYLGYTGGIRAIEDIYGQVLSTYR